MSTTRGEVTVTGRDGQVYTLKLGIAAICQLEETLDRPVLSLFGELEKGTVRVTTLREFVKAATSHKTNEEASLVLENVGITPMLSGMTDSLLATFGVAKNGHGSANPPAPARKSRAGAGSSKASASSASSSSV